MLNTDGFLLVEIIDVNEGWVDCDHVVEAGVFGVWAETEASQHVSLSARNWGSLKYADLVPTRVWEHQHCGHHPPNLKAF